ncbi:MAG: hypothetical protein ACON39_03255 [Coraliomargaritaceae bacterium]
MPSLAAELKEKEPLNYHRGEPHRIRVTLIALSVALFVHLFLYWFVPARYFFRPMAVPGPEEIELELEMVTVDSVKPEDMRFVEVNPEAPENQPDRKDQYSSRSTQAADPSRNDSLLDAPKVEGTEPSQKIIDGKLEQPALPVVVAPVLPAPGVSASVEDSAAEAVAARIVPTLPLPDFLESTDRTEDPSGRSLERKEMEANTLEDLPEETPIALTQGVAGADNRLPVPERVPVDLADRKLVPQARPRLAPELVTGPIMQSMGSSTRRGALSIDATFSEFGEYEQQFYAALQLGWYQEIEFHQPIDTASTVAIRFTMQSDGTIGEITVLQSNASLLATTLCESALAKRSPFRAWTKEMIAVFGLERTLTVRFNYR